jgi:hypothetical protein
MCHHLYSYFTSNNAHLEAKSKAPHCYGLNEHHYKHLPLMLCPLHTPHLLRWVRKLPVGVNMTMAMINLGFM